MPASSTTRSFRLAALALAALLAIGAAAGASASGETPTPEPTPTASPTPYPQSTITVRFVHDGEPVVARYSTARQIADGVPCFGTAALGGEGGEFLIQWPLAPSPDQPLECSKGPPTSIRFEFEYGGGLHFSAEILWDGGNKTVEVEVPAEAIYQVPSPSVSPSPSPVGLPRSGASTSQTRFPGELIPGILGLVFLLGAFALTRRGLK
jgi:hypothetical protein